MGVTGEERESTTNVDTRLWKACRKGNYELCVMLLKRNGNAMHREDATGNTCLHMATYGGFMDVVDLLLRYSEKRQGRDGGEECKSDASSNNEQQLQDKCGSISLASRNDRGETALFIACNEGHADLACYLCRRMCPREVNMLDNFGRSALWVAANRGGSSGGLVVCALHAAGGNLMQANQHGETPLWTAAKHGHLQTVRCLCDLRCAELKKNPPAGTSSPSPNQTLDQCLDEVANDRSSPLAAALEADQLDVVDLLVTYGATAWKNVALLGVGVDEEEVPSLSSSSSMSRLRAHTLPCPPTGGGGRGRGGDGGSNRWRK